ncbi:choice-of-anchor D domain-containing protein [Verrucomicrobiota bacterium]
MFSLLLVLLSVLPAEASLDILIIGSSQTLDTSEKAFSPVNIAEQLQNILKKDPLVREPVNVVVDSYYRSSDDVVTGYGDRKVTCYVHTLVQHYYWPEDRTNMLKNLRGQAGTDWDYVIMMDDPYMLANVPGYHAEGVNLIAAEVLKGEAVPLLLMQWPDPSSSFSVKHFGEISYRVGDGAGATVVPAGYAWDTLKRKDTHANHPTPRGAYLAAACIYSEIFNRSAAHSRYIYNNPIADQAWRTVKTERGKVHYKGNYSFISPICFGKNFDRHCDYNHSGTSTESGTSRNLQILLQNMKMSYKLHQIVFKKIVPMEVRPSDFNYGRSWGYEPGKRYNPDPAVSEISYAYAFQDSGKDNAASLSHRYSIDKRGDFRPGTEGRVIRDILTKKELVKGARCVPDRIMWCKMYDLDPTYKAVHGHKTEYYLACTAAYMLTSLSGRCPIADEPLNRESSEWDSWLGSVVGYKTAVRMSTLKGRASGFQVLPSSATFTKLILSEGLDTENMTVKFRLAPIKDVTVKVSIDAPGAASINTPTTLLFTPKNYETPQTVTVKALPGTDYYAPFNVVFKTTSDDPVYNNLYDQWKYTVIRTSEMSVAGSGNTISAGDNTPSSSDHTEFGYAKPRSSTVTREFTISNSADSKMDLELSGTPAVSIKSKKPDFTVLKQPAKTKIAPGSSETFSIKFNPGSTGMKSAEVSIANNDHDENPYTFTIQGAGVTDIPIVNNKLGATNIVDNDAELRGTLTDGLYSGIYVYWGKSDGGTTPSRWDNVNELHGIAQGDFSLDLDDLDFDTTYYYRVFATNAAGASWAPASSSFTADYELQPVDNFVVHRGVLTQAAGEIKATLRNGVDYKLDPSTTTANAFIRIVNSHFVGGGNTPTNANISGSSEFVYIANPKNLLTSVDFVRPAADPRKNKNVGLTVFWELIEYIGPAGGPNEIIVRDHNVITGKDKNELVLTGPVLNAISDTNRVVVFIAGQLRDMHTAEINASRQPVFTRVQRGWNPPRVSYAVVEFTGSNWKNIQRMEHTLSKDRKEEVKPIEAVDPVRTFMHVQHRSRSRFTAPMKQTMGVWLSGPGKLSFMGQQTDETTVAVVWLIENKEFHPRMRAKVQHLTSSHSGNPGLYGPEVWTKRINPVRAMSNASVMGMAAQYILGRTESSDGSIVSPSLTAVDEVTLWQATAETDVDCWFSVVEWPRGSKSISRDRDIRRR